MKPYYQDNHTELYAKDCRQMTELADNSVQCVVTSPPYWGLRKYSGEQELRWGGDEKCEHKWGTQLKDNRHDHTWATSSPIENRPQTQYVEVAKGQYCGTCGAWKGAYGLEPTPEMYVQHTIEILREIRRVLRKDGVVFWNIGDSYNSKEPSDGRSFRRDKATVLPGIARGKRIPRGSGRWGGGGVSGPGLKPKDLCLIPFRLAIAAQEDGWWVRSVIIWSKPNPMPESVTDRPTESHEYILMLTKSARYYWDADAVRERGFYPAGEIRRGGEDHKEFMSDSRTTHGLHAKDWIGDGGRNLRSVWEFPTQPYPEAHFAVFPEKLPELCIKAATPEAGCCSKCGAPWERVIEVDYKKNRPSAGNDPRSRNEDRLTQSREIFGSQGWRGNNLLRDVTTLGWQPTCKCNADKVPSLVLDPFAGAGTTLWVAKKLNRKAVGYEISEEYCELALKRNRQQVMGLT